MLSLSPTSSWWLNICWVIGTACCITAIPYKWGGARTGHTRTVLTLLLPGPRLVPQIEKPHEVPEAMLADIEKNINVRW